MRRIIAVAVTAGLLAGCGGEAKPPGEAPPPASSVFDKTDKDMPKKGKEKKDGAGIG